MSKKGTSLARYHSPSQPHEDADGIELPNVSTKFPCSTTETGEVSPEIASLFRHAQDATKTEIIDLPVHTSPSQHAPATLTDIQPLVSPRGCLSNHD